MTTTATVKPETHELSLADTCDRCGHTEDTDSSGFTHYGSISTAYVLVSLPSGNDLRFCGHHYREYELALVTQGAVVEADTRVCLQQGNRQQGEAS